jgi:NADH-quinone oxidoreductase subunit J
MLASLLASNASSAATLHDASAWAVFIVGAAMILTGAFGVVLLRNPVHCALMLILTLFGIALLFIDQSADFLAAVQIIVYAGAVVILFLFVIMFLGVDRKDAVAADSTRFQRPAAIVLGIVALVLEPLVDRHP